MLSKEDNELLCRVGPGTPMGELMRQYWIPVLMSSELPEPDCRQLRLRILGEDLLAFRDTQGRVGVLDVYCSHRRASLYFGRNEQGGIRCVYHGWKYDVAGNCIDMPTELPDSNFKEKLLHPAYPCVERGGVVWMYMGSRTEPPGPPEFAWLAVPANQIELSKRWQESNYMQALEGDIDSAHLSMLHSQLTARADRRGVAGSTPSYNDRDQHPQFETIDTEWGVIIGARRAAEADSYYWRANLFLFPFHTMPPGSGGPGHPTLSEKIWVPIDDENTMVWVVSVNPEGPFTEAERVARRAGLANRPGDHQYRPADGGPDSAWRTTYNRANDFQIDWEIQKTRMFSGLPGIPAQDGGIQASMDPICDRNGEHLGTTDLGIIRVRQRLLEAARALRDRSVTPPGVDSPDAYHVGSGSLVLPKATPWAADAQALVDSLKRS